MNLGEWLDSKKKDDFYLMHLSYGDKNRRVNLEERERLWNFALGKNPTGRNLIGLDWPDEVKTDWNNLTDTEKQAVSIPWPSQFNLFCNEMIADDDVVIVNGIFYFLGLAVLTEQEYHYDRKLTGKRGSGFFDHLRNVEWKTKHDYEGTPYPDHFMVSIEQF
ncbi:MAG: hypothetical protein ABSC20_11435 [Candidatus Bathyarchaeia archaeon]|jgi:hypothetical protein